MPLFVLQPTDDEVRSIDGERMGLGYADTPTDMVWTNRHTQLTHGALVFCCTDGLIDQVGGSKNIAFGKRRLRQALQRHRTRPIPELTRLLMEEFDAYQGRHTRRDDLTVLSLRID